MNAAVQKADLSAKRIAEAAEPALPPCSARPVAADHGSSFVDRMMRSWTALDSSPLLYTFYEMQHAAWWPLRQLAEATETTFRNPLLPASYTVLGRTMAAGAEMIERATRRFGKPAWGLDYTEIGGQSVAVTVEPVDQHPFCNLLHFRRDTDRRDPKVLVVAPLSGHHATLLRGTVEALLPHHDVYVTDWLDARIVPLARGHFDFDDFIAYIVHFLKRLGPDVHVLGVCQPAPPVLAAIALLAAEEPDLQPRSMTLMGGPIDTRAAPTEVTELAETRPIEWFERTVIATVPFNYPGAFRKVYPGFIQLSGFMQMNLDRHVTQHVKLFEHLARGSNDEAHKTKEFYDEYMSVLDLTAEFYLQTVQTVFQNHDLPLGRMMWRGKLVEPARISRTALLTVEGELDDISALGQTTAAHRLCSGIPVEHRLAHMQEKVGHYGIFNGSRWRQQICPLVRDFIRAHHEGEALSPLPDDAAKAPALVEPPGYRPALRGEDYRAATVKPADLSAYNQPHTD